MQPVKRLYAGFMHVVGEFGPLQKLSENARVSDAYGWQRWGASLLAIHDIKRMIALELPWWNVATTREVAEHLASHRNARGFEYGAGASSIWLAKRAGTVISVEHHPDWHGMITPMIGRFANATLWQRD